MSVEKDGIKRVLREHTGRNMRKLSTWKMNVTDI